MPRPIFIGLTLFALIFLSFYEKGEEVISWSQRNKLTWSDYKGKPQKRFAAASTVYSLGRHVFAEEGKVKASIEAYFYCNDSWKKDDWINDEVLAHEQKHFDIVELYARRFRKQISGMVFLGLKDAEKKVEAVYQILNKEMDVYQDKYDDETDGSMNGDGQRRWNSKIAGEIKLLDEYSAPLVTLKLKSGN